MRRAVAIFTNVTRGAEAYDEAPEVELGRLRNARRFTGDLEGESRAELPTAATRRA